MRHALFYGREALYWLAAALVRRLLPPAAVEIVLAVCGLWCLLSPLLLWVAWSQAVFLLILASSFGACAVFCIVAIGAEPAKRRRRGGSFGDVRAARPPR